jgi:hypothetical protein
MSRSKEVDPTQVGAGQAFRIVPHEFDEHEGEIDDQDAQAQWEEWGEALKHSESTGSIRAYKLPMTEDGTPDVNSKGSKQIYLGTFEHQQYSFDTLCMHLRKAYMQPGEVMAVRLTAFTPGQRGTKFNRIITLQRSKDENETASGGSDFSALMREMRASQEQQARMMERILAPRAQEVLGPKADYLETATKIAGILSPIIAPALAAWIARPARKSDLGEMVAALASLKDLANGGDGSGSDDNSTTTIIKAVAPGALQLLSQLAANQRPAVVPVTRQRPRLPPAPPQPMAPARATTTATETQSELSPEDNAMLAQLVPQLEQLAALAAQGADPQEVAQLVMETLPDDPEIDERLYAFLNRKVAYMTLFALPAVKPHKEWFERLRFALLAEFETPETEGTPTPQPSQV